VADRANTAQSARAAAAEAQTEQPSTSNGRKGLLIDWGGVLTTNLFTSFHEYCVRMEIDPAELGKRFSADPEFRELLIALEKGALAEIDFEQRFAAVLGVQPDGLIDGLFAGVQPDTAMIEAVRAARVAGIRTALVSNSWGVHRYPHDMFAEIFDGVVISGQEGTPASPPSCACSSTTCPSTSRPPRSSAWLPSITRVPRRRSPSSSACSGSPLAANPVCRGHT
jgi:hypothetical protein